ncbi:OmpA family protein [Chelativorans sp. AA-79]|uniref:OmpA family protein n=1 Tax=Chelativorans sp. AA-79 TaxID=3028735 RepID=UPI0023F744E9|nr:OmpA family protein [Chelativorans sp. AA-79]WEX10406.1 DUF4892 domain-containing protein [Chelativorans sp. AA-79]
MARRKSIVPFLAAGLIAVSCLTAAAEDVADSADHPLIPRYEGAEIVRYENEAFTDYDLRTGKEAKTGTTSLEGKLARITYQGPAERSVLEVFRNYENALGEAGFETLFSCARLECGDIPRALESGPRYMLLWGEGDHRYLAAKLTRADGDVYAALYVTKNGSGGPAKGRAMVQLDVVELEAMEQKMVVVEASAMHDDLAREGRVALHGIQFDFDKDTLRPDSAPQIAEIAKLLKENPSFSVLVVGHTDMQGALDYNMDLSRRRAARVVEALVGEFGVAGERLNALGVGPAAPLASNDGEEGRALNRRVEIVKQ